MEIRNLPLKSLWHVFQFYTLYIHILPTPTYDLNICCRYQRRGLVFYQEKFHRNTHQQAVQNAEKLRPVGTVIDIRDKYTSFSIILLRSGSIRSCSKIPGRKEKSSETITKNADLNI